MDKYERHLLPEEVEAHMTDQIRMCGEACPRPEFHQTQYIVQALRLFVEHELSASALVDFLQRVTLPSTFALSDVEEEARCDHIPVENAYVWKGYLLNYLTNCLWGRFQPIFRTVVLALDVEERWLDVCPPHHTTRDQCVVDPYLNWRVATPAMWITVVGDSVALFTNLSHRLHHRLAGWPAVHNDAAWDMHVRAYCERKVTALAHQELANHKQQMAVLVGSMTVRSNLAVQAQEQWYSVLTTGTRVQVEQVVDQLPATFLHTKVHQVATLAKVLDRSAADRLVLIPLIWRERAVFPEMFRALYHHTAATVVDLRTLLRVVGHVPIAGSVLEPTPTSMAAAFHVLHRELQAAQDQVWSASQQQRWLRFLAVFNEPDWQTVLLDEFHSALASE